jgi:hypothetical protein
MPQEPLDPELRTIEDALGRLAPARSRLDRDRLMFEAGALSARSAPQHRWVWPSIAAVLALLAMSESVFLAVRPGTRTVLVQAPLPQEQPVSPRPVELIFDAEPSRSAAPDLWLPGDSAGLWLKRQVLRFGLEGLPDPPPLLTQARGSTPPPRSDSNPDAPLRRYELDKVLDLGGPS